MAQPAVPGSIDVVENLSEPRRTLNRLRAPIDPAKVVLAARNSPSFRDEKTGTRWTFDGSTFWTFDDPTSASWKADYANCRGLRGMMIWELSGDDPKGSLLAGMSTRLRNDNSTCHNVWLPLP
jgi:hypothetical protein